jgi:hypothetical protein
MTRRASRVTYVVVAACLLPIAACSGSQQGESPDLSVASDLLIPQFLLNGTYAAQLTAQASFDGGGSGTLTLDALLVAYSTPSDDPAVATVSADWHPCAVTLPGGLSVPYPFALEPLSISAADAGTLHGRGDGAQLSGMPTAVPIGWCGTAGGGLPDATTPLCPPPDGNDPNVCHYAAQKPCAFQTTDASNTVYPGVPVQATGLNPDADVLYIAAQLGYAVDATVGVHELDGHASTVSADWTVLACHLRAGGSCTPQQVAMLNAQKPQLTFGASTFQAQAQPQYFTCPQFTADVNAALSGTDPVDGGAPDGAASGMSFSIVQHELDEMGCATCHDRIQGPGRLHLVYQPWTMALAQANYQAILPWTLPATAGGLPGGRFVNGPAPVPGWLKQRWIDWIAKGAPF